MLRGNALAKLDEKGRLKLPAAFRSVIEPKYGNEFFVTSVTGESARIYPVQIFAQLEDRLLQASTVQPLVTRLRNTLNYYGANAVMDSQGRILIHPLLRDKTELNGEVAVLGHQNYLEVWNRSVVEAEVRNRMTEEELSQLASLGF